ncbi:MAG: polyphosphate:AMP phosphotransferase [Planctomycetota bacterium]|jgi:polyphosphate:AMP phosphotransferase|nr:polyphosphate:AMP phosphotransferase [Planctomycetota bacterium]
MLDRIITGDKVDKLAYKDAVEELRVALLEAQRTLMERKHSVVVLLGGSDALGVHECTNLLHEWMDPRGLQVNFFDEPTDEERQRPRYYRYWRHLPSHGRMALFSNAWTTRAVMMHLAGKLDKAGFDLGLSHARRFERMLANDGTLILKFWIHIDRDELKKRRNKAKDDPDTYWFFSEDDRRWYKQFEQSKDVVSYALEETHAPHAPWHVIDGKHKRGRNLTVVSTLLDALRRRNAEEPRQSSASLDSFRVRALPSRLDQVDLSQQLEKDSYNERLVEAQRKLLSLSREAMRRGRSTVMAFEGWDAGGKGGAIRRLTQAMDAEHYRVIPIAAPTEDELAHHYLWRFWNQLPLAGRCTIFDRSWYGRVLVERVEGYCDEAAWRRAFDEINEFEQQMTENGQLLIKFWLHIDQDEQLRRFKERENTPRKAHKITADDYRNREKWDRYLIAVNDMLERTDTTFAPWHVIPGNDKRYARVTIAETVVKALERHLA